MDFTLKKKKLNESVLSGNLHLSVIPAKCLMNFSLEIND